MRFSFILPVRNGGEYVKACVASILAQTLQDFNLIILENKSTDGTAEWLQTLRDSRITVIPSANPLSIEENWARILAIPKNEFITMTGHDDLFDSNYLQVMNDLINEFPDASLYQAHFRFIDARGEKIRACMQMYEKETANVFLEKFLQRKIDVNGTGFMLRSKDYDQLGGIPPYPNLLFADFELWINATKLSYKVTSNMECFSFRLHESTTTISTDVKMQSAFERFIYFLRSLKCDEMFNNVIEQDAVNFIFIWCRSLTHRLLRTPKSKRDGLSVSVFLEKCKNYADDLVPGNSFKPLKNLSVCVAWLIDKFSVTRGLFLVFKKIYSKPILD
jgi:glycosyltransferase involved in cell wall biosynthesis